MSVSLALRSWDDMDMMLVVSFIVPPTRVKIRATAYISMRESVTDVKISTSVKPRRAEYAKRARRRFRLLVIF